MYCNLYLTYFLILTSVVHIQRISMEFIITILNLKYSQDTWIFSFALDIN